MRIKRANVARSWRTFSSEVQREVFFSTTATTSAVHYAVKTGRARRIGPRLYTNQMSGSVEDICRRNWVYIAAGYFPGTVITGRTAFRFMPADDGSVFLTGRRRAEVDLPGLRLRVVPGAPPQDGDTRYMGHDVYVSSRPRAYLENLRTTRTRRGRVRRTLDREEIEDELVRFGSYDDDSLNRLRDQARTLAPGLGMEHEYADLTALIGTLLQTQEVKLRSSRARATAAGTPWDQARLERLERLGVALLSAGLPSLAEHASEDITVAAFYEAYFSNYIEGTEFTLAEARDIVFRGLVPEQRPRDAHDILGTYRLVADRYQRTRVPSDVDELIAILRSQHAAMLHERPDIGPGRWKTSNNHVGGREFVDVRLVDGTLREGYRIYDSLAAGFARAAFALFLVSEVHPFADGNGRTARLLMNAELSAAGQQRIIVTTRDRGDYLAALRGMTNLLNIPAYIRMLASLQRNTARLTFSTLDVAEVELSAAHAFNDPDEDVSATPLAALASGQD